MRANPERLRHANQLGWKARSLGMTLAEYQEIQAKGDCPAQTEDRINAFQAWIDGRQQTDQTQDQSEPVPVGDLVPA